ncbi:hypothetical protein KKB18_12305, partial [bacterium]|nr:hypothetical protein [bacterium]
MLPKGYIVNYSINSLGFRGNEFPSKKDKDKIRIISIGDSSTFGFFLNLEDTYPKLLETVLNDRVGEAKYEVINAGVMGYTSSQGRIYFEKILRQLQPDIMTFACGFNDVNKWFPDNYFKPENELVFELKERLKYLAFYRLADKVVHKLMGQYFGKPDIGPRVSVEGYNKNIEKLMSLCEKDGIYLIILPISFPELYTPLTKDLADKNSNVGLIDLSFIFQKHSKDFIEKGAASYNGISFDEILKRYYDDEHFNGGAG